MVSASSFTDNASYYSGGAIYAGSLYETLELSDSLFDSNSATYGYGGALYLSTFSHLSSTDTSYSENEAYYSGGAVYSDYLSDVEVAGGDFDANTASHGYGGALYHYPVYLGYGDNLTVSDATFTDNYTSAINNIFAYTGDGAAVYAADGSTDTWSDWLYNDWYLNIPTDTGGYFTFSTTADGNTNAAPGFDVYSLDGDCTNDNLSLSSTSALVDGGHPAYTDPDGSTSDIGAFGGSGASAWDADGDNSFVGDDCDEGDAAVHPGATETCDGVDNDCDGTVDSGATDASTWYADDDGDGYGDATDTVAECDQPAGYVADKSDCDDASASVSPAGTKVPYDGVDQNCDGMSDYDADGDGHDDAGHGGDDCYDADADIHPGAEETEGDGVHQDCDGEDGASDPPDTGGDDSGDDSGGDSRPDSGDSGDTGDADSGTEDGHDPDGDSGDPKVDSGGCGCATDPGTAGAAAGLLALGAALSRRRPGSRTPRG